MVPNNDDKIKTVYLVESTRIGNSRIFTPLILAVRINWSAKSTTVPKQRARPSARVFPPSAVTRTPIFPISCFYSVDHILLKYYCNVNNGRHPFIVLFFFHRDFKFRTTTNFYSLQQFIFKSSLDYFAVGKKCSQNLSYRV